VRVLLCISVRNLLIT